MPRGCGCRSQHRERAARLGLMKGVEFRAAESLSTSHLAHTHTFFSHFLPFTLIWSFWVNLLVWLPLLFSTVRAATAPGLRAKECLWDFPNVQHDLYLGQVDACLWSFLVLTKFKAVMCLAHLLGTRFRSSSGEGPYHHCSIMTLTNPSSKWEEAHHVRHIMQFGQRLGAEPFLLSSPGLLLGPNLLLSFFFPWQVILNNCRGIRHMFPIWTRN